MSSFVFVFIVWILIAVVSNATSRNKARSNHSSGTTYQSPTYQKQIEEYRKKQSAQQNFSAPRSSGTYQSTQRSQQKPPVQSYRRTVEADHLCDDDNHTEEVQPIAATSGRRGKDDLTAMVEEINSEHSDMDLSPIRSKRLTADELQKKKEELKTLLDSGIISADEYKSVLKDYTKHAAR